MVFLVREIVWTTLSAEQLPKRVVSLRRRNATLPERYRAADAKLLEGIEKVLQNT